MIGGVEGGRWFGADCKEKNDSQICLKSCKKLQKKNEKRCDGDKKKTIYNADDVIGGQECLGWVGWDSVIFFPKIILRSLNFKLTA